MIQLGFSSGYVAQGGDLGSKVVRILAVKYSEVKAAHLNYCFMQDPRNVSPDRYSTAEKKALEHSQRFITMGSAYGLSHATKPSTIGLAISSSPLALLSWIGEKFLDWTDETPSIDEILMSVSLYWLTDCFATTIYPYRERFTGTPGAGNPSSTSIGPWVSHGSLKRLAPCPARGSRLLGIWCFFASMIGEVTLLH